MKPKRQQQDRTFVKKKKKKKRKEKAATEALHTKWPVKIHNSKQWDFKIQKKRVAWKSLTIAAKLKNIFHLLGALVLPRKQIVIPREFTHILKILPP